MAFDPTLSSLVFFGGVAHYRNPQLQSDTWRWTGTQWTRILTPHSPPAMAGASFVYDTDHHIGVLVGSEGETWLLAHTRGGNGYLACGTDGAVYTFGDARFFGSAGNMHLNQPIVGMAATRSGRGYWLVARDGGIFTFGDARFFGSTGNIHLNQPIVGVAADPGAGGYWLVAGDGGVFAFGHAGFHGAVDPARPTVAVAAGPTGRGYWIFGSDGRVQAFGDAPPHGDALGRIRSPIVGATST